MDTEIERLVVSVRADTAAFARDVASMRGELEGPLAAGAGRAGKLIETSLAKALTSGKTGFGDLKKVALSALAEIAQAAIGSALAPRAPVQGDGLISSLLSGLIGAPGRSHGGPVSAGRSYWVGERGPELFTPSAGGRITPSGSTARPRDVRVSISLHSNRSDESRLLRQSSRQLAAAVRRSVERSG